MNSSVSPREGNGTPLQYSCLENPMDGGAWWAAVHGVAKSRAQLKRLHFHFSLSCIGEGNGNPLQYSCLENPRDGGAWWAAVCGVTQSLSPVWLCDPKNSRKPGFPVLHCLPEFALTHGVNKRNTEKKFKRNLFWTVASNGSDEKHRHLNATLE